MLTNHRQVKAAQGVDMNNKYGRSRGAVVVGEPLSRDEQRV